MYPALLPIKNRIEAIIPTSTQKKFSQKIVLPVPFFSGFSNNTVFNYLVPATPRTKITPISMDNRNYPSFNASSEFSEKISPSLETLLEELIE